MTPNYARMYLPEFAKTYGVELYMDSNGEILFPIHVRENDTMNRLEHGYAYYIYDEASKHRYNVHLFIDANMSYGALLRIFMTASDRFKEELRLALARANDNPVDNHPVEK